MKKAILEQIDSLIAEGSELTDNLLMTRWYKKVATFMRTALGEDEAGEFTALNSNDAWDRLAMRLGFLQGIAAKARGESEQREAANLEATASQQIAPLAELSPTRKVFVVHGHDEAAKEATARFLEKVDLEPIILHEQGSGGRTIIEKFEKYSGDVGFAVILLTPDDLGAARKEPEKKRPRARQNVVLEMGYFMGRLRRNRVCALHKGGVELPSDIQGVIYVEMDEKGAWRTKLAQELVQAKYAIKLEGLISG